MSVSQPRCLLKGGSGHAPRRVFVALADGDIIVAFCDGSSTTEDCRGIESARHVAVSANSTRLCGIIVYEDHRLKKSPSRT